MRVINDKAIAIGLMFVAGFFLVLSLLKADYIPLHFRIIVLLCMIIIALIVLIVTQKAMYRLAIAGTVTLFAVLLLSSFSFSKWLISFYGYELRAYTVLSVDGFIKEEKEKIGFVGDMSDVLVHNYSDYQIELYESYESAVTALNNGEIEAIVTYIEGSNKFLNLEWLGFDVHSDVRTAVKRN